MRTRSPWMLLPLLVAATDAGAQDGPGIVRSRANVYSVESADAAMDSAIARGRATLPVFHGYLGRAASGEVEVKLKARFSDGDAVEHMWISDVKFDGRVYSGVLESRPLGLTHVSAGDRVTVAPELVSDWMVVEDGVMLGNFTTMEVRRRMSPKEQARLDRMMGYRILSDTAIISLPPRRRE